MLAILPTDKAHLLVSTELNTVMSLQHVSSPGQIDHSRHSDCRLTTRPTCFSTCRTSRTATCTSSDQRLVVPARDKMLNLEIISNKNEYKPRETASYTILARNADGAPVSGAEVSLGVVDESIYSVAPDYSGNIKSEFYGMRYNSVETQLSIHTTASPVMPATSRWTSRKNKPTYQLADFKNEGESGPTDDPEEF